MKCVCKMLNAVPGALQVYNVFYLGEEKELKEGQYGWRKAECCTTGGGKLGKGQVRMCQDFGIYFRVGGIWKIRKVQRKQICVLKRTQRPLFGRLETGEAKVVFFPLHSMSVSWYL